MLKASLKQVRSELCAKVVWRGTVGSAFEERFGALLHVVTVSLDPSAVSSFDRPVECVQSDAEGLGGEGTWSDLVEPRYRRMMVLGTGLALLQQASGINSITFCSSSVSAAALAAAADSISACTALGYAFITLCVTGESFLAVTIKIVCPCETVVQC